MRNCSIVVETPGGNNLIIFIDSSDEDHVNIILEASNSDNSRVFSVETLGVDLSMIDKAIEEAKSANTDSQTSGEDFSDETEDNPSDEESQS